MDKVILWGVGTPRTLRPCWALHELGVEYETRVIRTRTTDMDDPEFLAVSPGRKIPAFQHGDLAITESGAITRYVMSAFGADDRSSRQQARIDRWTFFVLMEMDATALYVMRRHRDLAEIYGDAPAAVTTAIEYFARQVAMVENALADGREFLVDGRFSEADIHLATTLLWAVAYDLDIPDRCAAFLGHLQKRPAYVEAYNANQVQ